MKPIRLALMLKVIAMLLSLFALSSMTSLQADTVRQYEDIKNSFVHLGSGVPAVLYEPAIPSTKAKIAIFMMHADGDYLSFAPGTELARRGYRVLAANNSASKWHFNTDLDINQAMQEASLGVKYLRQLPGVEKIVLLGHSGGGALMAAYQNIAENGVQACQGPEKLIPCPDSLAGLSPADGVILLDSNFGLGVMVLLSLDPAVIDESTGMKTNPELDVFNPENGFDPEGSVYSDEFIKKFQTAAGKRNNLLIDTALERLKKIETGEGRYNDDEPYDIPGAMFLRFDNRLFPQDIRLLAHTRNAWPLLHKDGTSDTQVIYSVRKPFGKDSPTPSYEKGALKTTVKRYLSTYAVRTNDEFAYGPDSINGVDWSSSYSVPPGSVRGITKPLLTMGMTGSYEFMAAELIYENAKSADKSIAFVEGASHNFTPCNECETVPGLYGDTLKTTFDYVDKWLSKPGRFF